MNNILILLFFIGIGCFSSQAQDIHFSQYYNSPLSINPALTGVFQGDMRFIANYRSQWSSVPVGFNTIAASFDMKYFHKKLDNGYLSGGLMLFHDEAGDSELSLTQFNLSGSYTQILNDNLLMTAGFQAGPGQRSFKLDELRFGNQFDGEQFDRSRDIREDFRGTNIGFLDLSAGINFFIRNNDENAWANIGLSMYHINQPRVNFTNATDQHLPSRFSLYSFGNVVLNDKMQWILHAMGQKHNSYNELILGSGIHYMLNEENDLAMRFLTAYRLVGQNDAIIPMVEFYYQSWRLGLSYDINISDFKEATDGRGGPEISLQYLVLRVQPPKEFKVCPIF